jgi:SAM-dependent methyltransferase
MLADERHAWAPSASQPQPHEGISEAEQVRERYARRDERRDADRYSLLNDAAMLIMQERHREVARLLARLGWFHLDVIRVLEVGCGGGSNLLDLLRLGCVPEHLSGIELLPGSVERARRVLPAAVHIFPGDAVALSDAIPAESQDIVYQATVFSSLLDDRFQQQMADVMWRWVRPGGGILWYDFVFSNPRNPDVRGVPVARIRRLFPHGQVRTRRITLAPPLARAATAVHPALYPVLNVCPFLRTHVLAWVAKPLA